MKKSKYFNMYEHIPDFRLSGGHHLFHPLFEVIRSLYFTKLSHSSLPFISTVISESFAMDIIVIFLKIYITKSLILQQQKWIVIKISKYFSVASESGTCHEDKKYIIYPWSELDSELCLNLNSSNINRRCQFRLSGHGTYTLNILFEGYAFPLKLKRDMGWNIFQTTNEK